MKKAEIAVGWEARKRLQWAEGDLGQKLHKPREQFEIVAWEIGILH